MIIIVTMWHYTLQKFLNLHSALIVFLDDINWNPIEWDRAAEELTWERVGYQ